MTVDDCKLLETMNNSTKEKYTQMSQMSQRLMKEMSKLQNTCRLFFFSKPKRHHTKYMKIDADFSSFIQQIDDIHEQTAQMEKTAKALDEYSRYLGTKKMIFRYIDSYSLIFFHDRKQTFKNYTFQAVSHLA